MASQQAIKSRINSVSSTKQITKAMQLVAASKLRKAQEAALGPKAYIETAEEFLQTLAGHPDALKSTLFTPPETHNVITIIVTSDRGLAGAYNANVLKSAISALKDHSTNEVITIGKYAARFAAKLKDVRLLGPFDLDTEELEEKIVVPILKEVVDKFEAGQTKKVQVVYTKFISTVKQEVVLQQLLPIEAKYDGAKIDRIFEPSVEEVFDYALKRMLEAQLLQVVLEARASEHASRMLAMKNATDNAVELIDDLVLAFNNARQAKITQELAEISAGTEAMK